MKAEGAAGERGAGREGGGEGRFFSTWAATSSLVMRPSRPLPLIELISSAVRFACAAKFRAAGIIAGAAAADEEGAEAGPLRMRLLPHRLERLQLAAAVSSERLLPQLERLQYLWWQ